MMTALGTMVPDFDRAKDLITGDWYLVYSKARQEFVAAQGLREQGYVVYLPQLRQRRRVRSRLADVTDALFPRYLFVSSGWAGQSIAPVDSTPGVQKLARFGALYLPVGEAVVTALKFLLDLLGQRARTIVAAGDVGA